jgi:hypothetical protein
VRLSTLLITLLETRILHLPTLLGPPPAPTCNLQITVEGPSVVAKDLIVFTVVMPWHYAPETMRGNGPLQSSNSRDF